MQLCKNLCINGKAPPPRKTPRPNAATDPGTPTGQQGQPLHSTPGRKGSRRPTAGRTERRHRLPGQAPKTDSQPATTYTAPQDEPKPGRATSQAGKATPCKQTPAAVVARLSATPFRSCQQSTRESQHPTNPPNRETQPHHKPHTPILKP